MEKEPTNKENKQQQFKTDGGKTKSNAIEVPSIALPKGGGAIKGIDQKFTVNAVNGTSAFSIPLPVAAARGVAPALSLSYNSGSGNGIFGLGWNLSLPSIKRKTDKELPQYLDYIDSDTYLFSEAEDLVPEYQKEPDGSFSKDVNDAFIIRETDSVDTFWRIRYYKPRIEGLFARIERWTEKTTREIKWRVTTKDNMTTLFGWSSAARLSDPTNGLRVYEWLPELVMDDKGNCAHYQYKAEDDAGFDATLLHNKNRYKSGNITYTNLYIDKILYGNKTPYKQHDPFLSDSDYMFQTVFDYGQYDLSSPFGVTGDWAFRNDAFSEYKAGFEIRTTRLCRRVMQFHYFPELTGGSALVKSMDFNYDDNGNSGFTFLKTASARGYIKLSDGSYSDKSLPEMEFTYEAHQWNKKVKAIDISDLENAPTGLTAPYQFTDLYNEGLSGILSEQGGGWYYKRNLGDGHFEAAQLVTPKPSFRGLGKNLQLLDLDGDGQKQIVSLNNDPKGYFEISDDDQWQPFRSFEQLPNINLKDPNARLLDLNGDGKTDVLITEDHVLTWYESDGKKGFTDYHHTPKATDEEEGPALVFSDSTQTIFLADMSGDGLVDIVRIRNGEVCYWPNLGFGNFGAKVGMDHAPVFDDDHSFNPAWIRLTDIDGSGTPDLIYLGKNKFTCWLNFSGNAYSLAPFEIDAFPNIHAQTDITVCDLLGNGLSCIVWSSPLQKDAMQPLRYIDLMNSKKPHIMTAYKNNLGLEVEMEYTPSTKYYIQDKLAGKPWATKLHFPVYCVSKTTNRDRITGHTFTSLYSYHHGYYDHAEKEFRGFGRVDQTDTEVSEHWTSADGTNLTNAALNQAPVISKSWFHTGAYMQEANILNQFATEYWYEEMTRQGYPVTSYEIPLPPARIVPDDPINSSYVTGISPVERREAMRACKSMALRTEVFAQEGTPEKQLTPYTVGTHNCHIELIQPKGNNKYAVYCVKESEAITYSYERDTSDPRIAHTLNLATDMYGNVLQAASVVYPRMNADSSLPLETQAAQDKTAIIFTNNFYTNDAIDDDAYRLRLSYNVQTYELCGIPKTGTFYSLSEMESGWSSTSEIAYEDLSGGVGATKRLIEHIQSLFYLNDLSGAAGTGILESLGIPYENYQLVYTCNSTSNLLKNVFFGFDYDPAITQSRYVLIGHDYWIPSGTVQYLGTGETVSDAEARFFTPLSFTDPFGSVTSVSYDSNYYLFIESTSDALSNTASVLTFDYRTLSPTKMLDANDNITEMLMDELGLPKAMALYGKGSEADDLIGLTAETPGTERTDIQKYFDEANSDPGNSDNMEGAANLLLLHATTRFVYDFDCYKNSGGIQPPVTSTIMREEHYQDNNTSPIQMSFEYSNGAGQVVMKKMQAESGYAKQVTDNGDGTITVSTFNTAPYLRWIGNGRTILNNKGNPIMQYEPYFSVTAKYESAKELVEQGVTPVMHYDAPGRVIRTDYPDGTFSKTVFDSWKQLVYDQNDTSMDSDWYILRFNRLIDTELTGLGKDPAKEEQAAMKAAAHYNTPTAMHLDSMGRPVLTVETDELANSYTTMMEIDTEGNLRFVTDARGNKIMSYKYDMLGNMVYQDSSDSGRRWLFHNALGSPLFTWDERNHLLTFEYDVLHRPIRVKVKDGDGPAPFDNVIECFIYGEGQTDDKLLNLRGKLFQHYDTGGLEETPEYNFKGQSLKTIRTLAIDYKGVADWNIISGKLESSSYEIRTNYDAVGRISLQTAPDSSIITPSYSRRGVLVSETVEQSAVVTTHLQNIEYDAKGQRLSVLYGNGMKTAYVYDRETFRLNSLKTSRLNGRTATNFQDLSFTYDAIGNIVFKQDDHIPTVFYNSSIVQGTNEYAYDARYQLIEASGREMISSAAFGASDNWDDAPFKMIQYPSDSMAMQNYTQNYAYDEVGNILQLQHSASTTGSYTRDYTYNNSNNRLLSTQVGSDTYTYGYHAAHGFINNMPHLTVLEWNFKEEIAATSTQSVGSGTPETTYYQYDSQGTRLRKITENYASAGNIPTLKQERIYVAGWELYKEHSGASAGLTCETLSLIDEGHRFVMIETTDDPSAGISSVTRYQHPNHQGSTTLETNENGDVITYEEYHPFGTTSYQATNGSVTAAAKRYRYTGMERDDETGLEYHNARYYIAWLGRWMNCDPIGIGDGVNVYAYCGNNPVGNVDSSGTQTNPGAGLLTVGTGGAVASSEGAKASINTAALVKKTSEEAKVKKAAQKEQDMKKAMFLPRAQTDFLYGPEDPQYWLMKSNYNPERASLAATKKLADKEGGFMKAAIWINYGLDKVGEYGSPIVALKPPGGGTPFRLPQREMINKAPVENGGNGPIKPTPLPFDRHGYSAIPLEKGELTKSKIKIANNTITGKKIKFGDEAITNQNYDRVKPVQGVYHLVLHGTQKNGFELQDFFYRKYKFTTEQLAEQLFKSGYEKGTPIMLISCNTGALDKGTAYEVSQIFDAPVTAPTQRIRVRPDGSYHHLDEGKFRTFYRGTITE
jgi:RHS repeat-associated protein